MNGLELGREALALFRQVRGSMSLDQQCQRMSGYYTQWAYQGHERGIITYDDANEAGDDSPRDGSLVNEMPVGGFGYWTIGKYGHVAMCIGYNGKRALILHTSRQGDTVLELDPFWRVSHADTYLQKFRFWSFTNGRNPRMDVAPWSPRAANARQVGPRGARRREEPTTLGSNWDEAENFAPGAWVEWDGFIRSTLPGGQPNGDNIWLKKGSLYTAWAAMVPLAGDSLAGIVDLGTFARPIVTPRPEPEPVTPRPEPEPVTPEPEPEPVTPEPVTPEPEPVTPEPEPVTPEPEPVTPEPEPEPVTPERPRSALAAIIAAIVAAVGVALVTIASLFQ